MAPRLALAPSWHLGEQEDIGLPARMNRARASLVLVLKKGRGTRLQALPVTGDRQWIAASGKQGRLGRGDLRDQHLGEHGIVMLVFHGME